MLKLDAMTQHCDIIVRGLTQLSEFATLFFMNDVLMKELKKRKDGKTQDELAKELGISRTYLIDILNGRRSVEAIAEKLGYQKTVSYKKKKSPK